MTHDFYVIDENVLIVANNREGTARDACMLACIEFLLQCRAGLGLVLDEGYVIMNKYGNHCRHSGAPGVGDQFFVWARDNAATLHRVRLESDDDRGFAEFPDDRDLRAFDWDDRVYVAAACASEHECGIANAADSDYRDDAVVLARYVSVHELCPDDLRPSRA